jgi:N-terminal domain of anti-restriction factor ArdC
MAMDVYNIITEKISRSWKRVALLGANRGGASVRRETSCRRSCTVASTFGCSRCRVTSPYWATIRQINELGGSVRKGEKATPVVFWRIYVDGVEVKAGEHEPESQETEEQRKRRFVLRYFSVFNTEQCDLPASVTEKLALPEQREIDPINAC